MQSSVPNIVFKSFSTFIDHYVVVGRNPSGSTLVCEPIDSRRVLPEDGPSVVYTHITTFTVPIKVHDASNVSYTPHYGESDAIATPSRFEEVKSVSIWEHAVARSLFPSAVPLQM